MLQGHVLGFYLDRPVVRNPWHPVIPPKVSCLVGMFFGGPVIPSELTRCLWKDVFSREKRSICPFSAWFLDFFLWPTCAMACGNLLSKTCSRCPALLRGPSWTKPPSEPTLPFGMWQGKVPKMSLELQIGKLLSLGSSRLWVVNLGGFV